MKTIKLPETDYSGMRQFYQEELDKTLKRLQHIQSVLAQLGDTSVNIDTANLVPSDSGITAAVASTATATPKRKYRKKAGRKAMWGPVILKRMQQINRPLTYDELTDEIMQFSKLSPEKRISTKQAIVNVTFRLRSRDNKIDTFSNGSREKYLGLKKWFDADGKIMDEFRNKLPKPTAKPTAKKGKVIDKKEVTTKSIAAPATASAAAPIAKRKPGRPAGSKGKATKAAPKTVAPSTDKKPIVKKAKRGRPVGSKGKAKPAAAVKAATPKAKAVTLKPATKPAAKAKKAPKRVTKPVVRKVAVKAAPTSKASAKKKAATKKSPKK